MRNLLHDLRFGLRVMLKNAGFTFVLVVTIALGIGANTAIFSVVSAVLLRPLPYPEPERLAMLFLASPQQNMERISLSFADFLALRERNQSFEKVGGYTNTQNGFLLTGKGEPEQVSGTWVTAELFPLLGVRPALGRVPVAEDDRVGAEQVVLISHEFWQRRFNSDPNILRQTLTLGGESYTVIGVLPRDFRFSRGGVDVWPVAIFETPTRRGPFILQTVGRLKPGVTLEQAQGEFQSIVSQVQQQFQSAAQGSDQVRLVPLKEFVVGDVRTTLLVLLGAVLLVLLIASANVANLLLTRATAREKEIAIRSSLGADRRRLVWQFLAENLLLAVAGGLLGLLLGVIGVQALLALSPSGIPRLNEIGIDARVLGFTTLVTVLSGIFFGLVPVFQYSRLNLNDLLKEGDRGSTGGSGKRLRRVLVVAEFALALMLVVAAGLLISSFLRLQRVDPGYDPENVLTMQLSLPTAAYREPPQVNAFYDQLLQRVQALPGVEAAGVSTAVPPDRLEFANNFVVEGRPLEGNQKPPVAGQLLVTSGYFRALGVPLVKGRYFTAEDHADAPPVIIVSEAFARRQFPNEDPVGKRIQRGGPSPTAPWSTIVGVVRDVKYTGLDSADDMAMYVHYPQVPSRNAYIVIRSSLGPEALVPAVRREVGGMNQDLALTKVKTAEQLLYESVAQPRFRTLLLGVFAAVALLLSAVGIYGVMSYAVAQRTHELGIRMALGAQRGHIMKLILGQGLVLAVIGLVLGLVGALIATRILSTLLYGVSATDPVVFAATSLFLAAVALLASYVPARRATKVDPMVALRYE
jgi:predicted permease